MDRRLQSQKRPSVDSSIAHFAKASGNFFIPYKEFYKPDLIVEVYAFLEFELIGWALIRFLWSGKSSADSPAYAQFVGSKQQTQLQFRLQSN